MKAPTTLLVLFFCCLTHWALAQYDGANEGFAFRVIAPNHQYLINKNLKADDFGLGLEFEYLRHINEGLNFSLPLRLTQAKLPQDDQGRLRTTSVIGLDALLHLKYCQEPKFFYPHLYAGLGGVYRDLEDFDVELPLGVGLNFRLSRHLYLSTKGEYRLAFDDQKNHIQIGAGFLLLVGPGAAETPEVTDRDKDGVPDSEDLCPDDPGVVGLNGCPDTDGDGVTDGDDACPNEAGLPALGGCPDRDGDGVADREDECPDEAGPSDNKGCPIRDRDDDGIIDDEDACPDEPGVLSAQGCPDADGDGIADKDDNCPNDAGAAATQGCPDSDGDGVVDKDDRCPNTAGPASNNGCPEIEEEDQATLDFAMKAVQFETASATLKVTSNTILDQIVDIMNRYPDYQLRINGHTDSIGSSGPNQQLSERRAKSCYDYLLSQGISAERMSYRGFGESQPIADNRYKAGREQNRRVEFDLYLE
jgi:outer membrane protein OmpA-like peptidoglycan-associated protein